MTAPCPNLSKRANVDGTQNRLVKGRYIADPSGYETAFPLGHRVAIPGFTGIDDDLLNERLDERPTLGQFTLLREVLRTSGISSYYGCCSRASCKLRGSCLQ